MAGRGTTIAFVLARAGGRLLRLLPDGVRRRSSITAWSTPDPAPLAPLVPDTAVRVLIGPANSAGQGWQWARALERELADVGAVSMSVTPRAGDRGFDVDQRVELNRYRWSRAWSREQRRVVTTGFTHVLCESGRQLFGDTTGSVQSELRELRAAGVGVGLVFHGSDLRSPKRHAASSRWSPFRDTWEQTGLLTLRSGENARLAARFGGPVFVSTPDLLADLPGAAWLPVVVDRAPQQASPPPLQRGRPVVLHAPSSSHLKGTELIEPVLERLDAEGVIEYRRVAGIPAAEMPAQYADADVVLDQFRIGAYGAVAVEAMSAGRIVVARIEPAVREFIRTRTGRDLPILDADPETLEGVLRAMVEDPSTACELAAQGPGYAAAVHGGSYSAGVLAEFLGSG